MNKGTKAWLITGTCLILFGALLFVCAMSLNGWDFDKLSTLEYEAKTFVLEEAFSDLSIETDTGDIRFLPSEDGSRRVVICEQKKRNYQARIEKDTLIISGAGESKWYDHIGIDFSKPEILLYLPQGQYGALSIEAGTGDILIPRDFSFHSITVSGSTGSVECFASTTEHCRIDLSTGHIVAEDLDTKSLYLGISTGSITLSNVVSREDITLFASTGKVSVTDVQCDALLSVAGTGKLVLKDVDVGNALTLERSTGDVTLENCDAGQLSVLTDTGHVSLKNCDADQLSILTDTGDVSASLRSEKVFFAYTDTGDINVPKTTSGGICEITTSTGDIYVTLSQEGENP